MHHNLAFSTCDLLKYKVGNSTIILWTCPEKSIRMKSVKNAFYAQLLFWDTTDDAQ